MLIKAELSSKYFANLCHL